MSIVHVLEAGVGSVWPLAVAATVKECDPSANPLYGVGDVHPTAAPPSRLQLNVEPPAEDVKPKLADVSFTVPVGPDVMVVSGATDPLTAPLMFTLST